MCNPAILHMTWQEMITRLCAIRDRLRLIEVYDPETPHAVFAALDLCSPGMSENERSIVEIVIRHYETERVQT